jgi:hypothetical protein
VTTSPHDVTDTTPNFKFKGNVATEGGVLWRPLSAHLPKEQETDLTDEPRHLTTKKGNVARRRYEGTPVETLSKGIKDVAPLNSLSRRPTSTATASVLRFADFVLLFCYSFVTCLLFIVVTVIVTLNSNHASNRLIHSGPTKYSTN